jgi:hypothetical protein
MDFGTTIITSSCHIITMAVCIVNEELAAANYSFHITFVGHLVVDHLLA